MNHWVMKSEPNAYSFEDLQNEDDQTVMWEGVRNYEARNNLQSCAPGDRVLFYHSNAKPSGVVGMADRYVPCRRPTADDSEPSSRGCRVVTDHDA
jgi:predicted RNA-binding protein with PUA-like domain